MDYKRDGLLTPRVWRALRVEILAGYVTGRKRGFG
jgi:hypothetical protein